MERAVEGIRATTELNQILAYGIIDADDRPAANIGTLAAKGVFAIPAYLIEFLYYHTGTIKLMAARFEKFLNQKSEDFFNAAVEAVITAITKERKGLCAYIAEKPIRNFTLGRLPKMEDILKGAFNFVADPNSLYTKELEIFDNLVAEKKVDGLLVRYPFRPSPVIGAIVKAFGINKELYESGVRAAVQDTAAMKDHLHQLLGPVSKTLIPISDSGNSIVTTSDQNLAMTIPS